MRPAEPQKPEKAPALETEKPSEDTDSEWTPRQEPDAIPAERSDKPKDPSKL